MLHSHSKSQIIFLKTWLSNGHMKKFFQKWYFALEVSHTGCGLFLGEWDARVTRDQLAHMKPKSSLCGDRRDGRPSLGQHEKRMIITGFDGHLQRRNKTSNNLRSIKQSCFNQSINPSIDPSIDQTIKRSIERSIEQYQIKQSIEPSLTKAYFGTSMTSLEAHNNGVRTTLYSMLIDPGDLAVFHL